MMTPRSLLLVALAGAGLLAQQAPSQAPDPGPYLAQQPTVQLPARPLKAPAASPEAALAQEERDARFLMDLQIANQTRAAQSSENVRQNQEKASAALLEYYTRLLEPAGGPGSNVPGAASIFPGQAPQVPQVPGAAPQAATKVATAANNLDAAFAEDGPAIARKRGLAYVPKGTIIDIRLYTEVNTSIPGVVVGEVIYDVWDVDQRYIAIPRGTKVTGASSQMGTDTDAGGKVVFDTFIDNGRELPIAVPVVTSSRIGVTGVPGKVDYHWARVFGGSAALAVISAVTSGSQPAGANAAMTQSDVMRQNLVQQSGQLSNQFMQRFIQIKPDITLQAGESTKVIILQHMMIKPVQKVY